MLRSLTLLALAHRFKIPPSQKKTPSEKKKKKPKKMTLKRPSWTKKTKNCTVARLPKPFCGRNSFSLAVRWAVFAGVRSTEWNRTYTWGKRCRGCNFWGFGGVAKRGKFDVSNGRNGRFTMDLGCEKRLLQEGNNYIETNLLAPNLSCLMFYAFSGAFL